MLVDRARNKAEERQRGGEREGAAALDAKTFPAGECKKLRARRNFNLPRYQIFRIPSALRRGFNQLDGSTRRGGKVFRGNVSA